MPPALEAFRAARGLSLPALDRELSDLCAARAGFLADAGVLAHEDPARRGPPGLEGEVLAAGAEFPAVWAGWLASPAHRAVLEDPRWTRWGWGRAPRGTTWVWVVRFWAP